MSRPALLFAVQHRSVDLVAMTALHALRDELGLGEHLLDLRRDACILLEGAEADPAWAAACTATPHWFNPNKHRHALFAARSGAVQAVAEGTDLPEPWLTALVASDRPDLAAGEVAGNQALPAWLATKGNHPVTVAVWEHDGATDPLPQGVWPHRDVAVLRLRLWTLDLQAASADEARELAHRAVVATSRTQGLLVNPHLEGWAGVRGPIPSRPESAAR